MKREDYIAAEIFGYSYKHYQEKIDIRNVRFTKYMPKVVCILEKGIALNQSDGELANLLEVEVSRVKEYKEAYEDAIKIVDQRKPLESYKMGVRSTIDNLVDDSVMSAELKEQLIEQLEYRGRDLEFLINTENSWDMGLNNYE